MSFQRYSPGSQMPTKQELSEDSLKKLKQKRYRALWQSFKRKIPFLKTVGFVLLVLILLAIAVRNLNELFFNTSYFAVREIEVIGNKYFSDEYIIKTAQLAPAMNVFSVNREKIIKGLLKEPRIKKADLEFEGLYKIKVQIEERSPKVYAKSGFAFYEIADDHIVINTEGMGEKDIPILTGLDLSGVSVGDSMIKNDNYFVARKWVDNLGDKILQNISELNFSSIQNPYLFLLSGEKIFPKNLDDFKNRYDFLITLLDNLNKNNVDTFYLDMRGDHFVVRPQKKAGS